MEILSDGNLLARVLLTLATIGYGLITVKADFNRTHATNPLWTPHARFHVVWQITSYVGFGLIAFALIWTPGPYAVERLYAAAAFAGGHRVAFGVAEPAPAAAAGAAATVVIVVVVTAAAARAPAAAAGRATASVVVVVVIASAA